MWLFKLSRPEALECSTRLVEYVTYSDGSSIRKGAVSTSLQMNMHEVMQLGTGLVSAAMKSEEWSSE